MASQITGVSIVCSSVSSGADKRKHQSSASLAFVWGIHRWPVNSPHKGQLRGKCFHLITSSCLSPRWLPSRFPLMIPLIGMFGVYFSNSFLLVIHIQWKLRLAVVPLLAINVAVMLCKNVVIIPFEPSESKKKLPSNLNCNAKAVREMRPWRPPPPPPWTQRRYHVKTTSFWRQNGVVLT